MKTMKTLSCLCLVLLLTACVVSAGEDDATESYSLWIGTHWADFNDSNKKVREYLPGEEEWHPAFGLNYLARAENSIFRLDGHYCDKENVYGRAAATVGTRVKFSAQYRSLEHQTGQDLLENIEAREYLVSSGSPGGKILTHEILDADADYSTHRQEILNKLEALLSKKNDVRLSVMHRTILEHGSEQAIASNHCFSCHLTSRSRTVDRNQHEIETALDADLGPFDLGYRFGYRYFESTAPDVTAYYDPAKNPVSGLSAAEFSSRLIYDDATLVFGTPPKTEKQSHRLRFKTNVGQGRLASSVGYSRAKNKNTDLVAHAYTGAANYAVQLTPRMRLIARGTASRLTADDPFIDLPTFRDGAADLNEWDFDYTRFSTLDRWDTRLSAEVVSRLNPRLTLAVLVGYNRIDRDDYPVLEDGTVTQELIGQAKLRFRKGLRYTAWVKYRFEKVTDPFASARGLFEASGSGVLEPLIPISPWIFYFQREDLRYQKITSVPTDKHIFQWSSNYRPNDKTNLTVGLKGQYDKNGDLDSLDVKHFSVQPNLALSVTPDTRWTLATGYTYTYDKSQIPVAVALFDG